MSANEKIDFILNYFGILSLAAFALGLFLYYKYWG